MTLIKNAKISGKINDFLLNSVICIGFCKILQSGLLDEKTYYIVMNKLGKSLRDIAQE